MMCFVASISGSLAEVGTKEIGLRIIDADGADVMPPMVQSVPFEVRPSELVGTINLVINIGGLAFQKFGPYAIHLTLQGSDVARVPFRVTEPPTTA